MELECSELFSELNFLWFWAENNSAGSTIGLIGKNDKYI